MILRLKELLVKLSNLETLILDMNDWRKMGDSDLKLLADGISPLLQLKHVALGLRK